MKEKGGGGECSSSAQSVWALLARVKTNPIVPMASSQWEATASVQDACSLFLLNFLVFLFPKTLPPACEEEDITRNRKPKWQLWPYRAVQRVSLPSARQLYGLSRWRWLTSTCVFTPHLIKSRKSNAGRKKVRAEGNQLASYPSHSQKVRFFVLFFFLLRLARDIDYSYLCSLPRSFLSLHFNWFNLKCKPCAV